MTARPRVPSGLSRLGVGFYRKPTLDLARALLGKLLVHETPDGAAGGYIVEVEAYIGEEDPACHAAVGPTPRNAPMYGPAGRAYIYFTYGMHWCFNVVTARRWRPEAVLVRALEPAFGEALMRRRRGTNVSDRDLARGPARLCRALALDGGQNGTSLTTGGLYLAEGRPFPAILGVSARVGIRVGLDHPWRFFDAESRHVSPGRPGPPGGGARRCGTGPSAGRPRPARPLLRVEGGKG